MWTGSSRSTIFLVASDENLRREEDRKWRERQDDRVSALTTGETVQNDRLDDVEERLQDHDHLLEGDPTDKRDTGLKGDLQHLETRHNELRAILAPDALGHGGFLNRLKAAEDALGIGEKKAENRWKFAGIVVSGTLAAVAAIVVALLAIEPVRESIGHFIDARFSSKEGKSPPAKHGKAKRHGHTAAPVREAPTETEPNENGIDKKVSE